MTTNYDVGGRDRRAFLRDLTLGGACVLGGESALLAAPKIAPQW